MCSRSMPASWLAQGKAMGHSDALPTFRHKAFISYSHHDKTFAKKLHRRIEAYRMPMEIAAGRQNDRIGRIYLDNAELGAAADLPQAIASALENSERLIVIASANSLKSQWVRQEIAAFRQARPDGGIHYIAPPEHGKLNFEELFPSPHAPSRPKRIDVADAPRVVSVDDAGFDDASLAIISELADVHFDDLLNRQRVRRLRTLRYMVGGASVIATLILVLGLLSFAAAVKANRESERALTGKSELLAALSNDALKAGDATLAMRLALTGLPPEGSAHRYGWQSAVALSRAAQSMRERQLIVVPGERLLAFAPSSTHRGTHLLAAASGNLYVHTAGKVAQTIKLGLDKDGASIAFFLPETGMAVALGKRQVVTWDERSNAQQLLPLPSAANCMTTAPDEKAVAVTLSERVLVLGLPTLNELHSWPFKAGQVGACAVYSAKHKGLLTGFYDADGNNVLEWIDLDTREAKSVGKVSDLVVNLALAPSEQRAVVAVGDNSVWTVELPAQTLRKLAATDSPKLGLPLSLTYRSDGRSLLVGDSAGAAHLYDTASLQRQQVFAEHADTVTSIHLANQSGDVYSASNNGLAKIWAFQPVLGQQELLLREQHTFVAAASPSGRLAGTGTMDGHVTLWDLDQGVRRHASSQSCKGLVRAIALHDASKALAAACEDGNVHLLRPESAAVLLHDAGARVFNIAFGPQGELLFAASNGQTGSIDSKGRVTATSMARELHGIAPIPGTTKVLLSDSHGDATVFDMKEGKAVLELKDVKRRASPSENILSSRVSGDGKYAWAAGADDQLRCWELATGRMLANFPLSRAYSSTLTAGPKDQLAYVNNGVLHLWRPGMATPRQHFTPSAVHTVAFVPGQPTRIAAATRQGEVWLLDTERDQPYAYMKLAPRADSGLFGRELLLRGGPAPYVAMAASDGLVLADLPPPTAELVARLRTASPSAIRPLSKQDLQRFFLPMDSILEQQAQPVVDNAAVDRIVDKLLRLIGRLGRQRTPGQP